MPFARGQPNLATTNKTAISLITGLVVLATGAGGMYLVNSGTPKYILESQCFLKPDDAGGFSGPCYGIVSTVNNVDGGVVVDSGFTNKDATVVIADSGVGGKDATASIFPDASRDSGSISNDSGSAVSVDSGVVSPDASLAFLGTQLLNPPTHHDYSQLQPFSGDDTLILLFDPAKGYGIYKVPEVGSNALAVLYKALPAEVNAPRWRNSASHEIVYQIPGPTRLMSFNVDTGVVKTLYTSAFSFSYPSPTFEEPGDNGRLWPLLLHNGGGANETFEVVDINTGTKVFSIAFADLKLLGGSCTAPDLDWANVSELGTYALLQWKPAGYKRCQGLEAWSIATGTLTRHIMDAHTHSDQVVVIDNGVPREAMLTAVLASPENNNLPGLILEFLDMDPGSMDQWGSPLWSKDAKGRFVAGNFRFLLTIPWGAFSHVGCRANPGLPCTVTAAPGSTGILGTIWTIDPATGTSTILTAHMGSGTGPDADSAYWSQPRAVSARSGMIIVFDSDLMSGTGNARPFILRR